MENSCFLKKCEVVVGQLVEVVVSQIRKGHVTDPTPQMIESIKQNLQQVFTKLLQAYDESLFHMKLGTIVDQLLASLTSCKILERFLPMPLRYFAPHLRNGFTKTLHFAATRIMEAPTLPSKEQTLPSKEQTQLYEFGPCRVVITPRIIKVTLCDESDEFPEIYYISKPQYAPHVTCHKTLWILCDGIPSQGPTYQIVATHQFALQAMLLVADWFMDFSDNTLAYRV